MLKKQNHRQTVYQSKISQKNSLMNHNEVETYRFSVPSFLLKNIKNHISDGIPFSKNIALDGRKDRGNQGLH